jgi:N-formylglutamate deformylase
VPAGTLPGVNSPRNPSAQPAADAAASDVFTLIRGTSPLVVSVPHAGRELPADQHHRYVERAFATEDADWYLERLYRFAADEGATLLVARNSRYLIDLNRPPDNAPMYPGQNNTELCPTRFFTADPLYRPGQEPDATEIARRVQCFWQPYHSALQHEVAAAKARHGHAVLFDAHSIKSDLPWLFEGTLPHLNLGTVEGSSCDGSLRHALIDVLQAHPRYSHVVDGRFKGGTITRRYGRPADGVHAVQLEMSWRAYMDEVPPTWNEQRAAEVMPFLRDFVRALRDWRPGVSQP